MHFETTLFAEGFRFPECPRWQGGRLWFSDFFRQRVMVVDPAGRVEAVVELPDVPTGLGWNDYGRLLIVSAMSRRLLRLEDDELVEAADLSDVVDYPCNDMVVDGQGRAYITNMGYNFGEPGAVPAPGSIVLATEDGVARVVAEGLGFPNGIVISPDGRTLIVAESHTARLSAFEIEPNGSLRHRRIWAQFEDRGEYGASAGQITPDGITLDEEGAVWLASPNTRDVLRVRQGGEILARFPVDNIPLACMLGGPDRLTLFICTTGSLNPEDYDAPGRIETVQVDVPGAGLP